MENWHCPARGAILHARLRGCLLHANFKFWRATESLPRAFTHCHYTASVAMATVDIGLLTERTPRGRALDHQRHPDGSWLRCDYGASQQYNGAVQRLLALAREGEPGTLVPNLTVRARAGVDRDTATATNFRLRRGIEQRNGRQGFVLVPVQAPPTPTTPRALRAAPAPASIPIRFPAGWVYAVDVICRTGVCYEYVGTTAKRDVFERIEEHAAPDGGCILRRLPDPTAVVEFKPRPLDIVWDVAMMPSMETFYVARAIRNGGRSTCAVRTFCKTTGCRSQTHRGRRLSTR